jgi:VTC domain
VSAVEAGLAPFRPISLPDLDASVALRVRSDAKHVIDLATIHTLLDRLAPTHTALEIDGRRAFAYDSVYFDGPALESARAHVQRRRRRFKCRSRLYLDTQACAFELKVKGGRGETIKHRIPYAAGDHGTVTPAARAFLGEHLGALPHLAPTLHTRYTRITLAGPGERVTIDLDLSFGAARLRAGWAIVETKSARGAGLADRVLRELGSRPTSLSKYLIGAGMTRMAAPPNDTRLITRRYFEHA